MTAEPLYARIVSEIRERIVSGELRPGERVPSTRQITRQWGVAMATATRVLATLRQEGLVQPATGIGTVVAPTAGQPQPPKRSGRQPGPELTRDQVVRAAVALADRDGLAGLSMRRIAAELGVATMSLYRHVRGKDDLVNFMADAVFAPYQLPDPPPAGWRAQLELVARLQWRIYRRHPWLATVMSFTRPPLVPSAMAHTEWCMRALDGHGLPMTTVFLASVTLANYVRGTAVNFEPEALAEQDTGLTDDEWMLSQEALLARILGTGRFPRMHRAVAEPGFEFQLADLFEFGLARLLDGLAAQLSR